MMEGWPLEAICEHLEAVTYGDIKRLLINVPPGFMKSLLCNVFWPAWEWTAQGMPSRRHLNFSYSAHLTQRDNRRFRDLLLSHDHRELWGRPYELPKQGETLVANDKTGWKLATSVSGVGTGERGDVAVLDDPHNVKEAESDPVRQGTVTWFREALSNRLNNMEKDAIVVIMQRVHEEDVSGVIISEMSGEYEHLMIPMEWDGRAYTTSIGWTDPRAAADVDGDLAWPARFPPAVVKSLKTVMGPYAWASQYQQTPVPRGGGIFKSDWWQQWEGSTFPAMSAVIASLDSAYTEDEENDYSALTIWGVFEDDFGNPKVMLMHAMKKRLELHGPDPGPREPNEGLREYEARCQLSWGLVEWTAHLCKRFKVSRLLIEAKASGHTVAQEMRRLHKGSGFTVQLIDPGRQDKVARAHSVAPLFADYMVFAPDREWSDMVITEMAHFPKAAHDDLCLIGDTLIATKRGGVPIRDVVVGDMALTPEGWRAVTRSWQTGEAEVVTVAGVTGTGSHPVFTFDGGYVRMDSVTQAKPDVAKVTLCGLMRATLLRLSSSTASPTEGWEAVAATISPNRPRTPGGEGLRACMSRFGRLIQARQFRQAMKFITETATLSISTLTIWNAYRRACIAASQKGSTKKSGALTSRLSALWRQAGMAAQRAANGIESMWPSPSTNPARSTTHTPFWAPSPANGVVLRSSAGTAASSFAAADASCRSRRSVEGGELSPIPTTQPVYNLEIEGAHCYYANGVLVHNCDSATQALRWLRDNGMLLHAEEISRDTAERSVYRPDPKPLYPA